MCEESGRVGMVSNEIRRRSTHLPVDCGEHQYTVEFWVVRRSQDRDKFRRVPPQTLEHRPLQEQEEVRDVCANDRIDYRVWEGVR